MTFLSQCVKRFHWILLPSVLLSLYSCSLLDNEDPIVRERRLINELLQNKTGQFYKASKISLRSFLYMSDSINHKDDILPAPHLTYFLFHLPLIAREPTSLSSIKAYANATMEVYGLKDKLNTLHEDNYPTLLENYIYLYNLNYSTSPHPSTDTSLPVAGYNSSFEHIILLGLWMGSRKAPAEFLLYEASLFNPEQTPLFIAKIAGHLGCALTYYDKEYYHLSEQSANYYIADVEKNSTTIPSDFTFFPQNMLTARNEKSGYYQVHGIGMVMRGLSRRKIEKQEESLQDFEQFLSDMNNAGVDNEMVWLVGSMVALHREDSSKALYYLSKLENSPLFSPEEKEELILLKEYIAEQQHEKALIGIDSKLFAAKILFFYIKRNLANSDALNKLKQKKGMKEVFQFPTRLDSVYHDVVPTTTIDSVGTKLKDGVEKFWK